MKIFGYIFAAAVSTFALPAHAGSGSGIVHVIDVANTGAIMFTVDLHNNAPACSVTLNAFVFDGSTPGGKNKYALILAAANAKKPVTVLGTGNCAVWGDRETADYIIAAFN